MKKVTSKIIKYYKKAGLILLFFISIGCFRNKEENIITNIFKLNIGFNENELGLFSENNIIDSETITVDNSGGFFYISDRKNNKIMKITRTGVPILILYNPQDNPQLKTTILNNNSDTDNSNDESDNSDDIAFVKIYREFEIYSPEKITSDINKNIYVVNNDPKYKKITSGENVSGSMILKFNRKGELLFQIGNDGVNTDPFGDIINVIIDSANNLIVQEKTLKDYIFYKFDPSGQLLLKNEISNNDIPILNKERDLIVDIIDAKPGYVENGIYLTCQYVKKTVQNVSITNYETQYEKLFKYSPKDKKVTRMILKFDPEYLDISKLKKDDKTSHIFGDKTKILKPFLSFIGEDKNGRFIFSEKELVFDDLNQNIHTIYIYDNSGHLIKTQIIKYPVDIQFCSDFLMSPEGKLYSYFIKNEEVHFVSIKQ